MGQTSAIQGSARQTRCRDLWGGYCSVLVGPPDWSHDRHPDVPATQRAASDRRTPPEVITWLATQGVCRVRVAENPSTPPEVLAQLALSPFIDIIWEIAGNPNTPPDALERHSQNRNVVMTNIRTRVAENPNTLTSTLERLARDEYPSVRLRVALSDHTPLAVLELLLGDSNREVAAAAAFHPAMPASSRAMWQLAQ